MSNNEGLNTITGQLSEAQALIAELEAQLIKARQQGYNEGVEAAAQVAQNAFYQECCGNFDIHYGENGEPIGVRGCCGNPDVQPMAAHEIAHEIYALKKEGE